MCGHVGIAGDLAFKDELTLKRLLILDYFRGTDSTGFAAIRVNGDAKLAKIASHPLDLFDMKSFDQALNGNMSKVFIGHNRAATKGKVNGLNAHPFHFGHIIGAHNGTLDKASWKRLEEAIGEETDVDSAAIFKAFEKIGVEDTIALMEEGRNPSEGAWALVWYNQEDGTLNFLRNRHRPFWYAHDKEYKKVFWASEWPMIQAAAALAPSTNGYELAKSDKGYIYYETEADMWYKYDIDIFMKGSDKKPVVRHKQVKGREPAPVVSYAGGSSHPFGRESAETSGTTTSRGNSNITKLSPPTPLVLDLVGSRLSPLGSYMDKSRFDEIAKYGCSWCQADVAYTDVGVTVYDSQSEVLCPDCSGNDNHSRIYVGYSNLVDFHKKLAS